MARRVACFIFLLILAQIATAFVANNTLLKDPDNKLNGLKTRRKDKSTSSDKSSVEARNGAESGESLNVAFTDSADSSPDSEVVKKKNKRNKNRDPKSTVSRSGWRKWHRKCTKCPEDMQKKWRDPSIKWICGAYQRARRSFKSLCMMHLRNCQDGTMFTKIADHRCPEGTKDGVHPYNHHFFYDYHARLTDEDSSGRSKTTASSEDESSSVSESELEKRMPPFRFDSP